MLGRKSSSGPDDSGRSQEALARIADAAEYLAKAGMVRDHRLKLQSRDHFRELHSSLESFCGFLEKAGPMAAEAAKKAREMGKVDNLSRRDSLQVNSITVAKWDGWTRRCCELAAAGSGAVRALRHYLDKRVQCSIREALADCQDPLDLAANVEFLQNETQGVERVVAHLRRVVLEYPKACRSLAQDVQQFHRRLLERFGVDEEGDGEQKKPGFNIFDLFGGPAEPPKLDVPVYKNNTHLTAFLAELTNLIPGHIADKARAATARAHFRAELSAVADKEVLEWARTQQMYMRMARVLQNLHGFCVHAYQAMKQAGLPQAFEQEPGRTSSSYERLLQGSTSEAGHSESEEAFEAFDSSPLIEALSNFRPYAKPQADSGADEEEDGDKDNGRDQQAGRYKDIFCKLEAVLDAMLKKQGADAIEAQISELIELKKSLAKAEEKRTNARLVRDKKMGNFAYEPRQEALGRISLHRVPTENVGYDDVVGKSWRTVVELLDPLMRHAELGYFYSYGTMDDRVSNNVLVLGPYGCGKNMFLKALMADPRLVGVKMTYDRIVTPWAHQSEVNARLLYEFTYQKRVEHDKPGAICWDELDTVFGDPKRRASGSVTEATDAKIKKTLQSIWDGDTIYEGVSTIALSNAPAAIPPAIYRRFGHVVVIRPLDEEERQALISRLLGNLPLAPDFSEQVDWDSYLEKSDHAAGNIIKKIYNQVFRGFERKLTAAYPAGPKEANDRFKELALSGKPIGQAERLQILQECSGGVAVTPREFEETFTRVLSLQPNRNQMEQARLFYEVVEQRMAEAFKNVE